MIYNFSWARDPGVYGYFGNMKEQQAPDCSCYVKEGPFIGTSKNIDFIRYADVLLFKAEALIQLNRWNEALPLSMRSGQELLPAPNGLGSGCIQYL